MQYDYQSLAVGHWQKSQVRRFSDCFTADFGPYRSVNQLYSNKKIDKLKGLAYAWLFQVFCLCPEGYKLQDDWMTCRPDNACLESNGGCDQICVHRPDGKDHDCACRAGFRMDSQVDRSCVDVDECDELGREGACGHGECANAPGSYECLCHTGFVKARSV